MKKSNQTEAEYLAEDRATADYQSATEIYNDLCNLLEKKGYKMVADPDGKHASHSLYIKKKLEANTKIQYWALIQTELEWLGFNSVLETCIDSLGVGGSDVLSIARKLQANLTTQGADKKSLIAGIGHAKAMYSKTQHTKSLMGQLAHRQVPRLSWFPKLESLDVHTLLALFPRAEAEALLLMLGRAMVGVGGTNTLEGRIDHKMRAAAIIVGLEAGLGKSTLLSGLIAAARACGYDCTPLGDTSGRFGWGKVAASDIAFKDDLNKTSQTAILQSEKLKTIITGGALSTERKGVDSEETTANTTVFCCSNDYNLYDFRNMDEGSISRFNFLYTYNQAELTEYYPDFDARTDKNVARLAKQYKVSDNTLYTYILAHGVELFLSTLGLAVSELSVQRVGEDILQAKMLDLRERFIFSTKLEHVVNLVKSAATLTAYALAVIARRETREQRYQMLPDLAFDHPLLLATLCEYVYAKGDEPYLLQGVASNCREVLAKRLEDVSNRNGAKTAALAFEALTAELVSTQGATYPRSMGWYYRLWTEAKKTIPTQCEKFAETFHSSESFVDVENFPRTVKANLLTIRDLVNPT